MTDLPTDRDPRTDPRPGDVLATPYRTRHVQKVVPGHRGVGRYVYFTTPHGQLDTCSIESWRRWAKRATVEKRGDVPA